MANAFVAPWQNINPLSFIEAAKAGAQLGLEQRKQAQDALESSQRIGLGYAGLGNRYGIQELKNQNASARYRNSNGNQTDDGVEAYMSLARSHPDWSPDQVNLAAQGKLFGATNPNPDPTTALTKPTAQNRLRILETGNGGVIGVDPITGKKTVINPERPATMNVPEYIQPVEGKNADVTPASSGSWNPFNWGAGAHPAITNSPAVLPIPGKWTTRKVPVQNDSTAQDATAALTPRPTPLINGQPVVTPPAGGTIGGQPIDMSARQVSYDPTAALSGQPQAQVAPVQNNALPLPKSKDKLEKGKSYQTAKGIATWDGSQFTQ